MLLAGAQIAVTVALPLTVVKTVVAIPLIVVTEDEERVPRDVLNVTVAPSVTTLPLASFTVAVIMEVAPAAVTVEGFATKVIVLGTEVTVIVSVKIPAFPK